MYGSRGMEGPDCEHMAKGIQSDLALHFAQQSICELKQIKTMGKTFIVSRHPMRRESVRYSLNHIL